MIYVDGDDGDDFYCINEDLGFECAYPSCDCELSILAMMEEEDLDYFEEEDSG